MKSLRRDLLSKILSIVLITALLFALKTTPASRAEAAEPGAIDEVKVIVLNYHKIDNLDISLAIPPREFDRQMAYLSEHGFHTISPSELYAALTENAPLPKNPVLITFDDGYADNYKNAYPILQKYGLKATIFVITDFINQGIPDYITWGEAQEMEASGAVDIESHTMTHGSMTEMTDDDLRTELAGSKREIEQRLGKTVEFVAYPTGTYNLHIASLVKEAGYKGAFTIKYGNVDSDSNLYALERVPIFQTENTYSSFLERMQFVPTFDRLGWSKS